MNEIKRIHLGRQAFVIAVDAYKALTDYLDAIKTAVGDDAQQEVIEEIELRMAELLTERGVTGERAIVAADIEYLQVQLGNPGDFASDDEAVSEARKAADDHEPKVKRLFRDTDRAMLAGVSAGLAAYFSIDPVIVRLIFVVGVFTGGWIVPIYILLWLIIPEAKSNSEKLQMHGKAVTVDTLKTLVDQADVEGAARRASGFIRPLFELVGKIAMWCIGAGFITLGILTVMAVTIGGVGVLVNQDAIFSQGHFNASMRDYIFAAAIWSGMVIVGMLLTLVGISAIQKRWRLSGWATAVVISLLFASGTVASVLSPGIADKAQRYVDAQRHTKTVQLQSYDQVYISGRGTDYGSTITYEYKQANTAKVVYSYVGKPDLGDIKTKVSDSKLTIDARSFQNDVNCRWMCIFAGYEMKVTIYAPQLTDITLGEGSVSLSIDDHITQAAMRINPGLHGVVSMTNVIADKAIVTAVNGTTPTEVVLTNLQTEGGNTYSSSSIMQDSVTLSRLNELELTTNRTCSTGDDYSGTYSDAVVWLATMPASITVNGLQIKDEAQLHNLQDQGEPMANRYRCINLDAKHY